MNAAATAGVLSVRDSPSVTRGVVRKGDPMAALTDDALNYLGHGFSVIPTKQDKSPAVPWKRYQSQRATDAQVRKQFDKPGVTGIGIVCGPISGGLTVRDFDVDGTYADWSKKYADLARLLPTVVTPRGNHVYFACPTCSTRHLEDGELRAEGHYVLAPPSLHPTGVEYRWLVSLPAEGVPVIDDPAAAGLIPASDREHGADGANRSKEKTIEKIEAISGDAVEAAILSTLPLSPGQRNRAVFKLCRALKGIPSLADADPLQLRPIVEQWHKLALPVIQTKPFEETWIDFLKGWERVKFPAGQGPLDEVVRRLDLAELPQEALQYEQPQFRRLVLLCRELQRVSEERPFFLSVRTAGGLIGVSADTASRWMYLLQREGVLKLVAEATRHRARRYRYVPPVATVPGAIRTIGGLGNANH